MPKIELSVPEGALTSAEDDEPRLLVEVRVPEGALSDRRGAGLVEDAAKVVLGAAGLSQEDAGRVWFLIEEQREGTWGAGGPVIRFKELVALTKQSRGHVDA